jgi:hypothetical protein
MKITSYKQNSEKGFVIALLFGSMLVLAILAIFLYGSAQKAPPMVAPPPAKAVAIVRTNPAEPVKAISTNAAVLTNHHAPNPKLERPKEGIKIPGEQNLTTDSIPVLLDALWSGQKSEVQRERLRTLLRRWTEVDPQGAARWIDAQAYSPEQQEATLAVATAWAGQDFSGALDWVKQWPEDVQQNGLLTVGFEAARKSPREALDLAGTLGEGEGRNHLTLFALKQWAGTDSTSAIEWAGKLEQSPLRNQAFADIAVGMSEKDPVAAGKLAIEKLEPGEDQGRAVVSIVQRWAQTDPSQAAQWVGQFPKGELQNAALENLVQQWAENNPTQTADWLNGLADGNYRDHAIAIFSEKLAGTNPEAAANWAGSIVDPRHRQSELERVMERWREIDPQAAEAWQQKK